MANRHVTDSVTVTIHLISCFHMWKLIFTVVTVAVCCQALSHASEITARSVVFPNIIAGPLGNETAVAGYLPIATDGQPAHGDMFYYLFRSRNVETRATAPLILWLTGGPGCSSSLAMLMENGPYRVEKNLTLSYNPNSWNANADLLYVDQPLGTGFSNTTKGAYDSNEDEVSKDLYAFFQAFMTKFPEYQSREFHITGESYAGHYIPAFASYLMKQNTAKAGIIINLKSIAMGNAWVSPYDQYPAYSKFALENNLISDTKAKILDKAFQGCQSLIKSGSKVVALYECQLSLESITGIPIPKFNVYDIRLPCSSPPLCYDQINVVVKYMNLPHVKEALGATKDWQSCNMVIHTMMLGDWMAGFASNVGSLLDSGVRTLVYSGDKDFICNWRGGEAWVTALNYKNWIKAASKNWMVGGKTAGNSRSSDGLTFLVVKDAGHMVPLDQGENALDMIQRHVLGRECTFFFQ